MMSLQQILSNPMVERIGFAIMHSLWQCTAIAVLLAVVLVALRNRRTQVRYNVAVSALLLMVIATAVTVFVAGGAQQVAPVVAAEMPAAQAPGQVITSGEMPVVVADAAPEAVPVPVVIVIDESAANAAGIREKIEIAGPYLALAWIIGVLILSVWHLGGWAQLRRLRRVMLKPVEDHVSEKLERLARSLAVTRTIEIVESALVTVPTVIGAFKPVVLLPASALTGLSTEQLEMILAHELAHIKRNDYLMNLIQTAIDILLFYHPAAWYVSRKIRGERENCCDDIAVRVTGDSLKYARALTTLEEIKATHRRLAVAANGGNFFDRIARLVGKEDTRKTKPAWQTAVITMLVVFAAVLPLCFAMNAKAGEMSVKELVEDFFKHNYRDITARKTIEWGDESKDEKGNISIRYKYEATIWGKEKIVNNQTFTFDKEGEFVSVEDVGLTQAPRLEYLEWQSEKKKWWRPDGEIVTADDDLKILKRISQPAIGDASNSDYEWLQLHISHPAFDGKSVAGLRMFDKAGKQLKFLSATSFGVRTADERPGSLRWAHYVFSVGPKADFPERCDVEFDYCITEWKDNDNVKIKPGKEGVVVFGDGFHFGSIGTNSKGQAFISYFYNPQKTKSYQHRFAAITDDGSQVSSEVSNGGSPQLYKKECRFDVLLNKIKYFLFETRKVQTVKYTNVSLKAGHKTKVEIEPFKFNEDTLDRKPEVNILDKSEIKSGKTVTLDLTEGSAVLSGKDIKSFEDIYFALAEIKERPEKILQVTLSDPGMKADDVKRTKIVLMTWARDLKFKEVIFADEVTIDKTKAAEVIGKWWRAIRTGDVELMRQVVVYDNDEQLAEFTALAKSEMLPKEKDVIPEPILVNFTKTGDRKYRAAVIMPSGRSNAGISYELIVKDGGLKLDIHIKEVLRRQQDFRKMSMDEYLKKQTTITTTLWKNAEGKELEILAEKKIQFMRDNNLISKYAIEHKIKVPGADTGYIATCEEIIKKVEKMTPVQIRDMILKDIREHLKIDSNTKQVLSLQSLIDNAKSGAIVTVPKGVYTEAVKITKPLTLKGASKGECVIEVTVNEPALFIDTASKGEVTVEGLTIKWKLATSDRIEYASAVAVKDCKATIRNCEFMPLGNFRQSPTAARSYGFSKMYLDNCRFDGFDYTVCYSEATEGAVTNCMITKCKSQGVILYSGASADVIGNYIANSGKHAVRSTGGKLNMLDNLIVNNANRGVYLGNKTGSGRIANNVLIGNSVGISGFASADVKIENNVILDSKFAAIAMRGSCKLKIKDNIMQGNPTGVIVYSDNGENNNTLLGNTFYKNKENTKDIKTPANTITTDPLFNDAKNGDYSLKPGTVLENKQGLMDHSKIEKLWKLYLNSKPKNE